MTKHTGRAALAALFLMPTAVAAQGVGDRIALRIDHRIMRGLIAFVGREIERADLRGGRGAIERQQRADLFGIGARLQRLQRHRDKVRIAHVFGAIGVGAIGEIVDLQRGAQSRREPPGNAEV